MNNLNKILIGVIICLGCYIWYFNTNTDPVATQISKRAEVVTEAKIIAQKVDKRGIQHTIVEETNNVLPAELIETANVQLIDSLIAETDIKKKELNSVMKINQTILAKNLQAIQVIDSLKRLSYRYEDKNLYLSYTPNVDSNKAGKFDYRYNQDLDIVQYSRRNWFLGAEHDYVDISTNSLNSTINHVQKLTIKRNDKPFDVTASAKAIFLPNENVAGFGGQVRVRYKNLTLSGADLYFPNLKKYMPVVGFEYQFLKL